jgi:hypothetical protein
MGTDVEVPMVNWGNINRKSEVQFLGFTMTCLVSTDGKRVSAKFIQQVTVDNTRDPNVTLRTGIARVCNSYPPMLTR